MNYKLIAEEPRPNWWIAKQSLAMKDSWKRLYAPQWKWLTGQFPFFD